MCLSASESHRCDATHARCDATHAEIGGGPMDQFDYLRVQGSEICV